MNRFSRAIFLILVLTPILYLGGCTKLRQPPDKRYKPTYPHSDEFKTTHIHGLVFYSDSSGCKSCHGKDLLGGERGISCAKCHDGFPHTNEFKTTNAHGLKFFSDSSSCKTCHGKDLLGGELKVSCSKCHQNFPHSQEFKSTFIHGG